MPLPREDQETCIRLGFYDDTCHITTTNPTHARHLEGKGLVPSVSRIATKFEEKEDKKGRIVRTPVEWEDTCWNFTAPARWFKLPRPPKQMSDETKAKNAERLRKANAKDDETEESDDD